MKRVFLKIVDLTYSQNHQGAYNLVLEEINGKRKLPIVIGGFEAQAIAVELEKMTPTRPLTHDLIKTMAEGFDIVVEEVIIHNLLEGVFYAKVICNNSDKKLEMDARTSDAIAVAVRFNCPIVTYESILAKAGISLDINDIEKITEEEHSLMNFVNDELLSKSTEELKEMLNIALEEEDYEKASKLRDELNNRKES